MPVRDGCIKYRIYCIYIYPERPEPLEIVSVDGTNVVVRITPINPSNIPIDHYEVYVISTRGVRERTIIVNPGDNLTISIDGLTENTKYSFTVVAHVEDHTQAGISSPSQQSELVNVTIASIGKNVFHWLNTLQ